MSKLKALIQNPTIQKFVSLLSTDVLVRGANFLLIPVFLHLMPKEEFGVYGYLYNFAITCSLIMNLGYHGALPKLYSETKDNKSDNSSMLFTLSTTLFGFVASAFLIFYLTDLDAAFFDMVNQGEHSSFDYKSYRPYLFIALASMIFSNFLTYFFISAKKIRNIQTFNLIRLFACNGLAILVLYLSKDNDTALLRLSVTYIIELLICCIFSRQIIKEFIFKYNKTFIRTALKIGLPICFVALLNSFVNFGDKQFIMLYCGKEAMGAYNLATLLATIPLIVFQSFNFIWLPDFLGERDLNTLKRKTDRNAKIIVLLLLLISLIVWIGTWIIIQVNIFPANYKEILSYLPMLLISQILAAMILFYFNFFTYFKKTYISMTISVFTALMCSFMYKYAGQAYGAAGIASTLATINIITLLLYIGFAKYFLHKQIR